MVNSTGAITCARYAFAPNFYNYCGPDTGVNFREYVARSVTDRKLTEYISGFETLYPYLISIAQANKISDPLDYKVVEAYWVGNLLLKKVKPQATFQALTEGQKLHKRLSQKELKWLYPKIDKQARLHHSFHVFNVFTRTGHKTLTHTVETMDNCRIGWGQVLDDTLMLKTQKLIYKDGILSFVPDLKQVKNPVKELTPKRGDWVSFHWGFVCEKLTSTQLRWLSRLTQYHLDLANQTI